MFTRFVSCILEQIKLFKKIIIIMNSLPKYGPKLRTLCLVYLCVMHFLGLRDKKHHILRGDNFHKLYPLT